MFPGNLSEVKPRVMPPATLNMVDAKPIQPHAV